MDIKSIFKNITPAVAIMVVGVLGAYLVYDNYFSGESAAVQVSGFEPAAGEETMGGHDAMEAHDSMMATPEGEAVAPEVVVNVDEEGCVLDEAGNRSFDEAGSCVMAPVAEEVPTAMEGEMPAVEGEVAPAAE